MIKDTLREIPKIDEIIKDKRINELFNEFDREYILTNLRMIIERQRKNILESKDYDISIDYIYSELADNLKFKNKIIKVINATGVVLHTNLGRSILDKTVISDIETVMCNYSNLEFDLLTGKRGSRYDHLKGYFSYLTSAEDYHVVNNNAAATMLVLNTLAKNKEVIVSRGELVEIGGSFRIPEIMNLSGALLREVGTTNRTHLYDYANNINENTALIMKVHKSNYFIKGFTSSVNSIDILDVSLKSKIPLYEDLGSGFLADDYKILIEDNTIREKLEKGVDVISISGDKLLGGPQAGIILGKKKYIDLMKKNQLTRALRVCKLTLSALEKTLKLYINKEYNKIPVLRLLTRTEKDLYTQTINFKKELDLLNIKSEVVKGYSLVGGGSLPSKKLSSYKLLINSDEKRVHDISKALREYEIPIICNIKNDSLVFDFRCVKKEEELIILDALKEIINV